VNRQVQLAFVTAAVTLFVQVLFHRVVSAKLINNFAFLVISMTMLGFAVSGVVLTRWRRPLLARLDDTVAAAAALAALSIIAITSVFYHLDVGPQFPPLGSSVLLALLRWMPLSLLFAIPFAFCALVLGALLSAPELPARRIYGFDLAGSALGAFAVIPAIRGLGVEKSLLAAALILAAAALLLARPRLAWVRAIAVACTASVLAAALARDRLFAMRYPRGSMLDSAQAAGALEHVAWDPVARIEVSRIPPPDPDAMSFPSLIGEDRAFLARFHRMITQNNYAFTFAVDYDGRPESLRGIEQTIYSAAYQAGAAPAPRVLVAGVGGGFDVLTALHFGAREITGVEINAATVRILKDTYRDYFRSWVDDPRVTLVEDEARHYIATHPGAYDVIQLSGVDSYSGTAAAAHVFSENYLYTAEAFDLYLSRLTGAGIVNMMRLEHAPPKEMVRALTTAVAALRRAGVGEPARHVATITATNGAFTALLVKKTPFTHEEWDRLRRWTAGSRLFRLTAAPGLAPLGTIYQAFLKQADPRREAAFIAAYPFDISPVDDDRPFFFRFSRWSHLFTRDPVVRRAVPFMEYSLVALGLVTLAATLVCVYLPLRLLAAEGARVRGAARHAAFFAAIAVGYLGIEIALLQKFGLFLGHPNYALSVVLAALLLASGLGSLLSGRIVAPRGGLRFVSYALAAAILAERLLIFSRLPALVGLPFAARVAVVFALVTPIGLCLGVFMPTGLARLKVVAPEFSPWAWGVNGVFSVLAPILSVAVSMTWGMNALLLAAIPLYLAAGLLEPTSSAAGR
jgi:spermidine synthase